MSIISTFSQTCLRHFVESINNVREKFPYTFPSDSCAVNEEPLAERPRCECIDVEISMIFEEVRDIAVSHCNPRFTVTGHLVAAILFESSSFPDFEQCFPTKAMESAAASFPFLDEMKLHSELSVTYKRPESRLWSRSTTVLVLKAIITIPMTVCKAERRFSTLNRVKTFFRNTTSE